jgi:hypothetical protein
VGADPLNVHSRIQHGYFLLGTEKIDLPATQISPTATTEQPSAWLHETHITVHSKTVEGFRVHTNGVAYPTGLPFGKRVPPRLASYATGRWVFIGDQAISRDQRLSLCFRCPGLSPTYPRLSFLQRA